MHDVEHHTSCYLRDLLLTPAHRDPEITTFLTLWNYEEYWHGEAHRAVLAAHDEPAGRRASPRCARAWAGNDRIAQPVACLAPSLGARHFLAVHMTWGASTSGHAAGYHAWRAAPTTRC